jgi:hypothetical protein
MFEAILGGEKFETLKLSGGLSSGAENLIKLKVSQINLS